MLNVFNSCKDSITWWLYQNSKRGVYNVEYNKLITEDRITCICALNA